MKKFACGMIAAVALGGAIGLGTLAAPATAAPLAAGVATTNTDVSAQRYYARRGMVRRGPVCTVRKVVTRGPMGRRVVRTTRVCR